MTSAEQHLLAAILAEPEADAPRLMYADEIEGDEGDPRPERAEFIRVGCELARRFGIPESDPVVTGDPAADAEEKSLRRRVEGLWLFGRSFWFERLPGTMKYADGPGFTIGTFEGYVYGFARGFLASVSMSWDAFRAHADELFAANPVTEVTLTTWPAGVAANVGDGRDEWDAGLAEDALRERWPRVKVWEVPAVEIETLYAATTRQRRAFNAATDRLPVTRVTAPRPPSP